MVKFGTGVTVAIMAAAKMGHTSLDKSSKWQEKENVEWAGGVIKKDSIQDAFA